MYMVLLDSVYMEMFNTREHQGLDDVTVYGICAQSRFTVSPLCLYNTYICICVCVCVCIFVYGGYNVGICVGIKWWMGFGQLKDA